MARKTKPLTNISKSFSELRKGIKRVSKSVAKSQKKKAAAQAKIKIPQSNSTQTSYTLRDFNIPKGRTFLQFMSNAIGKGDEIDAKYLRKGEGWVAKFRTPEGQDISTKQVYENFDLLMNALLERYFQAQKGKSISSKPVSTILSDVQIVRFKGGRGIANTAKVYQAQRGEEIRMENEEKKEIRHRLGVSKGERFTAALKRNLDRFDSAIELLNKQNDTINKQSKLIEKLTKQLAKPAKKVAKKSAPKKAVKKPTQKRGTKNAKTKTNTNRVQPKRSKPTSAKPATKKPTTKKAAKQSVRKSGRKKK